MRVTALAAELLSFAAAPARAVEARDEGPPTLVLTPIIASLRYPFQAIGFGARVLYRQPKVVQLSAALRYVAGDDGKPRFVRAPPPTPEQLRWLAERVAVRARGVRQLLPLVPATATPAPTALALAAVFDVCVEGVSPSLRSPRNRTLSRPKPFTALSRSIAGPPSTAPGCLRPANSALWVGEGGAGNHSREGEKERRPGEGAVRRCRQTGLILVPRVPLPGQEV